MPDIGISLAISYYDHASDLLRGKVKPEGIALTAMELPVEEIFFRTPLLLVEDEKHSGHEQRHFALGKTNANRLLCIVFTMRGTEIRVISARNMSRKERSYYEETSESDTSIQN